MTRILAIIFTISVFLAPSYSHSIDSISGISDSDLLKTCQEGCRMMGVNGSEYSSCVYCCANEC